MKIRLSLETGRLQETSYASSTVETVHQLARKKYHEIMNTKTFYHYTQNTYKRKHPPTQPTHARTKHPGSFSKCQTKSVIFRKRAACILHVRKSASQKNTCPRWSSHKYICHKCHGKPDPPPEIAELTPNENRQSLGTGPSPKSILRQAHAFKLHSK